MHFFRKYVNVINSFEMIDAYALLIFSLTSMLCFLLFFVYRWGVRDGQWLMLLLEMMEHHQ